MNKEDTRTPQRPSPINIRLRGEESGGQLAVIEYVAAAGVGGPPLHVHPLHGEGFYVLDGELTFRAGDEVLTGGPGTFVFAPQGTPHTFANLSERDARILVLCTPAGFERYFERLSNGEASAPPAAEAVAVGPGISTPAGEPHEE